jgi:hypothetical protein
MRTQLPYSAESRITISTADIMIPISLTKGWRPCRMDLGAVMVITWVGLGLSGVVACTLVHVYMSIRLRDSQ